MKNTRIEMEASIEETKKELDVKNNEVETLEEKPKAEENGNLHIKSTDHANKARIIYILRTPDFVTLVLLF